MRRRMMGARGVVFVHAVMMAACGASPVVPEPNFAVRAFGVLRGPLAPTEVVFGPADGMSSVVGVAVRGRDAAPPWAIDDEASARACAAHLGDPVLVPMQAHFAGESPWTEHSWLVPPDGHGDPTADSGAVSRRRAIAKVQYDLRVDARSALPRRDSVYDGYARCCAEHDCGWGYVSAAYRGEGTARFVDAAGETVHEQRVTGWIAGHVQITVDRAKPVLGAAGPISDLGEPEPDDDARSDEQALFVEPVGAGFLWREQAGAIAENEALRRVEGAVGSDLVGPLIAPRSSAWIVMSVVGAVATAVGIGLLGLALADEDHFFWALPASAALSLGGLILLVTGLTTPALYDGDAAPSNNVVAEPDARILVERLRRAGP